MLMLCTKNTKTKVKLESRHHRRLLPQSCVTLWCHSAFHMWPDHMYSYELWPRKVFCEVTVSFDHHNPISPPSSYCEQWAGQRGNVSGVSYQILTGSRKQPFSLLTRILNNKMAACKCKQDNYRWKEDSDASASHRSCKHWIWFMLEGERQVQQQRGEKRAQTWSRRWEVDDNRAMGNKRRMKTTNKNSSRGLNNPTLSPPPPPRRRRKHEHVRQQI